MSFEPKVTGPLAREMALREKAEFRQGNPDALRKYWETGKGGELIGWGNPEEGDLTRCFNLTRKYFDTDDDAWGFCQERKIAVSGHPNMLSTDGLLEFANPCHDADDGKFCSTPGGTAGLPGGARAGEVDGIPGTQLAAAKPQNVGNKYKAGDITRLGYDTIPDDKVGAVTKQIPMVPGFEHFAGRTDPAALREIAQEQSENIEDMFNNAMLIDNGTGTAKAHSDWYPYVNRWAHDQSRDSGFPPEAVMGAAAVLSPSADWANNVAWAEQVVGIMKNEKTTVVQPEWLAAQEVAAQAAHKFKTKQHERANTKLLAEGGTAKDFEIAPPVVGANAHLAGKTLDQLSPEEAAVAIRGAHEFYGKMVHQKGGAAGLGDAKNIATPQSGENFAKAISILRNPSAANIDKQLGNSHKVRSFFQNMRDPLNTKEADVTVDSHHIGMAVGLPLTGTSALMKQIYDKPKANATGLTGTYPVTVEATRLATARINKKMGTKYTPAQVQSITWEAQRAMYDKKPKSLVKQIGDIRSLYRRGLIPKNEMLARVENARLSGKDDNGKSYKNPTLAEIRKKFQAELGKGK